MEGREERRRKGLGCTQGLARMLNLVFANRTLWESVCMNLDRSPSSLPLSPRGWGTSLPPAGIIIDRVRSNWKTVMASLYLASLSLSLFPSLFLLLPLETPPPSASGYDAGTRPTGFLANSEFQL